jgi:hypothetical protein
MNLTEGTPTYRCEHVHKGDDGLWSSTDAIEVPNPDRSIQGFPIRSTQQFAKGAAVLNETAAVDCFREGPAVGRAASPIDRKRQMPPRRRCARSAVRGRFLVIWLAHVHFKTAPAQTFQARMKRARKEGYPRGALEAKLFRLAVGKVIERRQAMDRLQTIIDEGRDELEAQHALERGQGLGIGFLVQIA